MDIINSSSRKRMSDAYFQGLRHRLQMGEHLDAEERYNLRSYENITGLNYGLEHPDDYWKD